MKILLKQLQLFKGKIERNIDMMTKLYAINIVAGRYPFSKVPRVLKPGVKEQIALMVEDEALVEELIKED